ncbi:LacI family transcriptional regulator [Evansella caseinilytica]|uniref:LacI family transcriptional regulator n=1 Tax=Evansella caseinilytica TaxID=1503961 RepID=A0A1H3GE03_9BACI|nr:LacI family DNA-binding transcriptional regulator [Evansella caseinilytica]SDY00724.1 LacI family transcriptional regulator [Evansella caseinilytica]
MATIKDVAKLANVAVSTASYVLNGVDKVSPKTKEKVLEAARQLNYQKNGFAADLKRTKTNTIALILDDISGPFYSVLVEGVQDIVSKEGYGLVACSSHGGASSTAVKFLTEKRADGCIVFSHKMTDDIIRSASSGNYPIVLLDRKLECDSTVMIEVDNEDGGYHATDFLLKNGHKKIAYISGPAESYNSRMRFAGYKKALEDAGVGLDSKWVFEGDFTNRGGELATTMLLAQSDKPTAIFYGNDEMAIGGMAALKRAGLKIPDDISIIGFDDILEAKYVNLTTVKQPKYELGALSAHIIFRMLNGEEVERSSKLYTEIIERQSVRRMT